MLNILSKYLNVGNERTVKAKKNIIGMLFLKGGSILLSLIIVPLTIGYISSYQYGIWLTLSSIVGWISFFDIGFGNGLRNKFVEAVSRNDILLAKKYVSTTYFLLSFIFGSIWVLSLIIIPLINWDAILNIKDANSINIIVVCGIIVTNFCFQFVLKLISTLLTAIQKPAFSALLDVIGQVIFVALLLPFIYFSSHGSLVTLSILNTFAFISVLLFFSIWFFHKELKQYSPSWSYFNLKYIKDLLPIGIKFFLLQIIALIIYQTSNIIIVHNFGPDYVTTYNIAYKYTFVLNMLFMIVVAPFWSAFTEAYTVGDFKWMIGIRNKLVTIFGCLCALGLLFLLISPWVYKIWIGNLVKIPFNLTLSLIIYQLITTWGSLFSTMLYGIGKIKVQLIVSFISGIIFIPLSLLFINYIGILGIVIAPSILGILGTCWVGPYQLSMLLNKKEYGIWNK